MIEVEQKSPGLKEKAGSIEILVLGLLALIVLALAFPLVGLEEARTMSSLERPLLAESHFLESGR